MSVKRKACNKCTNKVGGSAAIHCFGETSKTTHVTTYWPRGATTIAPFWPVKLQTVSTNGVKLGELHT